MTSTDMPFASDFPVATEAQWRALVDKVLKGGDFDKRLVAKTYDGVRIQPLSGAARQATPILRAGAGRSWGIAARVDHPDPVVANELALADLEGGADTLVLVSKGSRSARGFGLDVTSVDVLDRALQGVMLDLIRLRIEPAWSGSAGTAPVVADQVMKRQVAPAAVSIDFGVDPLGQAMITGNFDEFWQNGAALDIIRFVTWARGAGFAGPLITCDMRPVHEAGGSEAQELGVGLAMAVAYIRAMSRVNANQPGTAMSITDAFRALSFMVAVDADQLLGITKLRALRRLMARVEMASSVEPRPITIHAETAWRMLTKRDPAVNMLRSTMAVFAAGVGGADTITVLPHTSALGLPDKLARRIARSTQLVLLEESGLAHVADPAAGSGAIEALTEDLAKAAWAVFQDIERAGGIQSALTSGHVQGMIAKTSAARMRDVATRRLAITGTSEFPQLTEPPAVVLDVKSRTLEPIGEEVCVPLPSIRLAEPFEALRDRADAHLATTGARPRLFLAALGPLAEHSARTLWVTNAVAAGGIEAIGPADGYTSSVDVGRAFGECGATIVADSATRVTVACITGADETYAALAEATAGVLKAAGARHVWLAGKPGQGEAILRAAGVDGFLSAGQDLVEALTAMQRQIGVAV